MGKNFMKNNKIRLILIIGLLVLSVFLILKFVASGPKDAWVCKEGSWLKQGNPSEPVPETGCGDETVATETSVIETPEQVVLRFYTFLQSYQGNYLATDAYKYNGSLTENFKAQISAEVAGFLNGGYDPLICAQDIPASFEVGTAVVYADTAIVKLDQTFDSGEKTISIELTKQNDTWKISAVKCNAENSAETAQPAPTETRFIVYFNNAKRQRAENGDVKNCKMVYGVERILPIPNASYKDKLNELMKGPTDKEKTAGFTSLFSYKTANSVKSVKIVEKIAYVNLVDLTKNIESLQTVCSVDSLLSQITETLKHNGEVDEVRFAIEGDSKRFYEWTGHGCSYLNDMCRNVNFE